MVRIQKLKRTGRRDREKKREKKNRSLKGSLAVVWPYYDGPRAV